MKKFGGMMQRQIELLLFVLLNIYLYIQHHRAHFSVQRKYPKSENAKPGIQVRWSLVDTSLEPFLFS